MTHLAEQQSLPLFRPLRSEMSRAILDAPMTLPREVSDWRNGERNINEPSILALSNRLVMVDLLTAADAFEDSGFSSSRRSAGMSIVTDLPTASWAV